MAQYLPQFGSPPNQDHFTRWNPTARAGVSRVLEGAAPFTWTSDILENAFAVLDDQCGKARPWT